MKPFSKILLTTLLSSSALLAMHAVPAKPGLINVTQADGTMLAIRLMGDESHHICLSEDGYLLANRNDIYYYADADDNGNLIVSDIKATPTGKPKSAQAKAFTRNIDMERVFEKLNSRSQTAKTRRITPAKGPGLFPGNHFPAIGKQKAIVVLVEYTDVKMTLSNAYDYFNRMLNESGFSDYNGTGSAYDFFMESSCGQFEPEFDVFGPITLAHNRSYYGGNDWYGNDSNPEQMVIEACQQLDATVDFSEYDRDGDGYIDNVFIFYAGQGEASGGSSDTVWPHSWNVSSATSTPYYFDGVRLDRYGCSNEYEFGRPDGVGTFVHEFSHVMGLPDLYATSYTSAFTPGSWSALDYGPYNNDGCTPPLYSAFERYSLNWVEPLPIEGPLNATLRPIGANQVGIIHTQSSDEFFLIENRQQTSWDTYIPGHGMLVWHVDYDEYVWDQNRVNNTPSHQYVDLEEADGTQSEYSREGDAFPGTSNRTSFTDDTNPSMKTWRGQKLNLPITEIAESPDGIITFKVCGGREPFEPVVANECNEVSSESFVASWQSAGANAQYMLNVYVCQEDKNGNLGEPVSVEGYKDLPVGNATSYEVTGLTPETTYCFTVSVGDAWEMSAPSNMITVYTGRLPITRRSVEAEEAEDISQNGFSAAWLPLEDAESYLIDVYTKEWGAPIADVCDFGEGTALSFPEGWASTSGSAYANTAYSGTATPALRLSTAADYLTSPEYADNVRTLKFWHRGSGTNAGDMITVSAFADYQWAVIAQYAITTEKGGETIEVDPELIPAGATRIRIAFTRTGTKGALAIDDVEIGHGMTYTDIPMPEYTSYAAGSGTRCMISGLQPSTTYYYIVRGVDDQGLISLPSREICVTTTEGNGIRQSVSDSHFRIVNRDGIILISGVAPGADLQVSDLAGRVIARIQADGMGNCKTALPASGIYFINSGSQCRKVIVK